MAEEAPRTERTARLAHVYNRAQVRFQRRLLARAAHRWRMEGGEGRPWPWPQWPVPDLTDEAWQLCNRLILATEQDAGLGRPSLRRR